MRTIDEPTPTQTASRWVAYAGIALAVLGLIIPLWIWRAELNSRALTANLVSSVALQIASTAPMPDIQITIGGKNVESPYLSMLTLTNTGAKPIMAGEYESPIEIGIGGGAKLERASVLSSEPNGLVPELVSETNVVKIKPLLLNSDDTLQLAIITSGPAPTFLPRARIAGISKITLEDKRVKKNYWVSLIVSLGMSLIATLLYTFFAYATVTRKKIVLNKPISLLLLFGCMLVASRLDRQSGVDLNLPDYSLYSMVISTIILVVLSVIFGGTQKQDYTPPI
jgi:ABC-type glycerol-3-phosphate transport system permease component